MAKTEVYTCDICKQSKSKNDLASISVTSRGIEIKNTYGGITIDICPECLKKKGFVVEQKEIEAEREAVQKQNKQTLEDKICDFLIDMGVAFEI